MDWAYCIFPLAENSLNSILMALFMGRAWAAFSRFLFFFSLFLYIYESAVSGHKKLIPLNAVDSLYYDLLCWLK